MTTYPIWRDLWIEYPGSATYNFRIKDGSGNVIYTGKAYPAPGAAKTRTRVNDICADYMAAHALPQFGQAFTPQMLAEGFSLEYLSGTWTILESWEFFADWSYEPTFDPDVDGLSFPIVRRIPRWGSLLVGVATEDNSITAVINFRDGTHINKVITVSRTADFNNDFNEDFATTRETNPYGVAYIPLGSYTGDIVSVEVLGFTWEVLDCYRYAIHYVNAHGGWDTFTPERWELMTDAYARREIRHGYDNGDPTQRAVDVYANEITRGITFRTGELTDLGAGRMHHLLGSPCVYLEDSAKGVFIPVTVQDGGCEYRTFRNQGGRRVEYTFSVRVAYDMQRR